MTVSRFHIFILNLAFLALCVGIDGHFRLSFAEEPQLSGKNLYVQHCARCHGDSGTGDGPAHTMQRPWPRDFTEGQFKFRSTPLNTLPTLEDIEKSISQGNLRTSMPPFKNILTSDEISAIAGYVWNLAYEKSGLPDGRDQKLEYATSLDNIVRTPVSIRLGKSVFQENCASCHGDDGRGLGPISPYIYDKDNFWVVTPDLTDPLAYGGGSEVSDILMRLKTGIALSRMPAFGDILDEASLEAVSIYVKSLQVEVEDRNLISKDKWREVLPAHVRGEYMVRAMSCALCHNAYDETGYYYPDLYLAGGVGITLPGLGIFYSRNLTSHREDGLADWTEEQIVRTIMTGHAPDRRLEAFSMPWVFFSHLDLEDAHDIAIYLKSLKPIQNEIPDRQYYSFPQRLWTRIKQLFGFEYGRLEYPYFNQGTRHEEISQDEK